MHVPVGIRSFEHNVVRDDQPDVNPPAEGTSTQGTSSNAPVFHLSASAKPLLGSFAVIGAILLGLYTAQVPILLKLTHLQASLLGSCIPTISAKWLVLPALLDSLSCTDRQRSQPSFPSLTWMLSTDIGSLCWHRLSPPTLMPVGYRKSEASLSPRVSLFLLLPLLPPNVLQNRRMSILRRQTVDPQCRRYPRRHPLTVVS